MKSPFQSIRWRIQAWHGLILFIAIGAFCLTAYQLAWFNQLRRIDSEVQHLERELIRTLLRQNKVNRTTASQSTESENDPTKGARPLLPEEFLTLLESDSIEVPETMSARFSGDEASHTFFSIADKDGKILLQSDNAPTQLEFLALPEGSEREETSRSIGGYREIARSAPFGLRTIVGRELGPERAEMRRYALSLASIGLALWGLGLLGGWWLAGKAIHPIQRISRTASRIAEGNLDERIDTDGGTSELDELSHVLNHTFERLNAAFERQRQFTADASHELRTPLTILLSETQRMRKPGLQRDTSEYLESFDLCHESCERMRHLVESLLLLARQDSNSPSQRQSECDLATLIQDCAAHYLNLAESKQIAVELALEACPVHADPNLLKIVFNNLIGNAIQHHPGNGSVWLQCRLLNQQIELTVRDDGPGISDEDLPRIFDRFFRADKVRGSQDSHSGLGLALVKAILQRMASEITVQSRIGTGTTFTVSIPVRSPSPEA